MLIMQQSLVLMLFLCSSLVYCQTCSKTSPCTTNACCSQWGNCGYGPDFCGKNCLGNCQAKSECGKYGKREKCPLNVCCSEFGFCGTTDDFCSTTKKCQNNCGNVTLPTCSNDQTKLLQVGYYASWAAIRTCHAYQARNIDPRSYTHLNFAFGKISKGVMVEPTTEETTEINDFTNLKQINSALKVLVSVGGWAFNDPGPTRYEFHNIVASAGSRKTFIDSVVNYLKKYNFDGIDIDYEYPAAEDRGGSPEDTDNYVNLVKELRNAFGSNYLITIAAPASYWYLRHFKIGEMSKYLDFINVMTYDIHGTWDSDIKSLGPFVKSHTNIKEIEEAFVLFLRDGVKADKLTFGLGYYGRSFTLSDPSCTTVGCKFSGPGKAGPCTKSPGTLAWFEIQDIIDKNPQTSVKFDSSSMSKIMTWDKDQWIAFDDEQTLAMRRRYAAEHCFKGVMIWSIDQGLNIINDNRKTLSRYGQINVAMLEFVYKTIGNTFRFAINGNADNRMDYQMLSVSVFEQTESGRGKRAGPGPNKPCLPLTLHLLAIAIRNIPFFTEQLQHIYLGLRGNSNGTRHIVPNDPANPIEEVIVRTIDDRWAFIGGRITERVEYLRAEIHPRHYRPNTRIDFPDSGNTSTQYMRANMNAVNGDERGHIVASVLGGPPLLYNMFPQHRSSNRNYLSTHFLTDWYNTEREMAQFLSQNRGYIRWTVALAYDDDNSARPTRIAFEATFLNNQNQVVTRLFGTQQNCEASTRNVNGRCMGF